MDEKIINAAGKFGKNASKAGFFASHPKLKIAVAVATGVAGGILLYELGCGIAKKVAKARAAKKAAAENENNE